MANYIQGEKNFYPDIKPFTPDYKFLSAAMDARESKYLAGWQATNDLYSRVYADLSREDNREIQQQFIDKLGPEIQKISGLDLSLQRNVDAANKVFAPFFEDDLIVKDMVYTSTYRDQMVKANQFANSSQVDIQNKYNPIGIEKMQYELRDFQNSDRQQALNAPLPKYVINPDLYNTGQKFLEELGNKQLGIPGLTITKPRWSTDPGKDGKFGTKDDVVNTDWVIKDTNGELIKGEAYNQLMRGLYQNPRIQEFYQARAFVESRRFADEAVQAGGASSVQQGVQMWADAQIATFDQRNKKIIDQKESQLRDMQVMTVTWEDYKSKSGVTPNEEKIMKDNLSEADQLQQDLERRLELDNLATSESTDVTGLVSKAYSLLANEYITNDMKAAASSFSKRGEKTEMEVNPFALEEKKRKYELEKIAAKYNADLNLQKDRQAFDAKKLEYERETELLKLGAKDGSGGYFQQSRQGITTDVTDPIGSAFQIDEDGDLVKDDFFKANQAAISSKRDQLFEDKLNLIPEMLPARYSNVKDNRFTVELEGPDGLETKTGTPDEILEKLKTQKLDEDDQPTGEYLYAASIEKIFNDNSEWFGDLSSREKELTPDQRNETSLFGKVYNKLYNANPYSLGIVRDEENFLQGVEQNGNAFYEAGTNANAALMESDKLYRTMVEKGYPLPYIEENGVKTYMTKSEYQKKFREMALDGQIKNFDYAGITGPGSAGDDNPDWMTRQSKRVPSSNPLSKSGFDIVTETVIDEEAIGAKSGYIYDELLKSLDNTMGSSAGGNTFIQTTRNLNRGEGTNIVFVPSAQVTTNTTPVNGSPADILLATWDTQIKRDKSSGKGIGSFVVLPTDQNDLQEFDVTKPDLASSKAIAANYIYEQVITLDPKSVGKFNFTYYPSYGVEEVDEDGNITNTPAAAYVLKDFSQDFFDKLTGEKAVIPSGLTADDIKTALTDGIAYTFARDADISSNSYENIGGGSYIFNRINSSTNNQYVYTEPGLENNATPTGSLTFNKLSDQTFEYIIVTNTYNTNMDPEKGPINTNTPYIRSQTRGTIDKGGARYKDVLDARFDILTQKLKQVKSENTAAKNKMAAANKK